MVWCGRYSVLHREVQDAQPVGSVVLTGRPRGLGVHSPDDYGQNKLPDHASQSRESNEPPRGRGDPDQR